MASGETRRRRACAARDRHAAEGGERLPHRGRHLGRGASGSATCPARAATTEPAHGCSAAGTRKVAGRWAARNGAGARSRPNVRYPTEILGAEVIRM